MSNGGGFLEIIRVLQNVGAQIRVHVHITHQIGLKLDHKDPSVMF